MTELNNKKEAYGRWKWGHDEEKYRSFSQARTGGIRESMLECC